MTQDRTNLEQMPPEEVAWRLAAYNPGGSFERELRNLWDQAGPALEESLRQNAGNDAVKGMRYVLTNAVDEDWIQWIANFGTQIYKDKLPLPKAVEQAAKVNAIMMAKLATEIRDEANRTAAMTTLQRFMTYEIEIVLTQIGRLLAHEAAEKRGLESEDFEQSVTTLVTAAAGHSSELRAKTVSTAASARGMLDKSSEVAAAAEQSALSMRDAAHTSGGLIRAIEDAKAEVETATAVAVRATEQAAQAVEVSNELSGHARAIESILGLIRNIANQTNLLSLNATIEAARAGDSGRGFAIVAQEVKLLASQTAGATDDIKAKIDAIQQATTKTVMANSSIKDTIEEVQTSARRLRDAMEEQAQSVTKITAAVDETALAADSMSSTIASIRADAEDVACEIKEVEVGFIQLDDQLAHVRTTASEFVRNISA